MAGGPGLLLGIDIGTTWSKAAVVTFDGIERSHGRRRTGWTEVPSGAEIDPDRLLEGALEAAGAALEGSPGGHVVGVGVTSMAETGVLLDRRGRAVGSSIAWHDARGEDQARALKRHFGAPAFVERTGRAPTRLCSAAKLRWLTENRGEARHGVRWLSIAEWVAHRLGAEQVSESSLASRTGFLDLRARAAWTDLVEWTGAPPPLLATVRPAGAHAGLIRDGPPRLEGAVLTVAGLDHSVAAIGAGAVRAGDVFDSCGTAEAFIRAIEPPVASSVGSIVERGVNVDWHVLPDRMALISGIHSGLAMRRMLARLRVDEADRDDLDRAVLRMAGESTPVEVLDVFSDSPAVRAASGATPAHVWRATLDAIAQRGAEVLEAIRSVGGPEGRLVVAGGGARSAAVREIKHAVLGPFVKPRVTEAGARGAALFAGLAAGVYSDVASFPEPEMEGKDS
jgi:sugar (pentulose or hexulose) kinase